MNSFYSDSELKSLGFRTIGKNALISRKASFYGAENMTIGDNVRIDDFCLLSGNIDIGDYVHIAAYVALFAGKKGVSIGSFSTLSSRCAVYAVTDDYSGAAMTNPMVPDVFRKVTESAVAIGKHVIVGTGSTILPGANIGEGVALGAHSLLTKQAEAWHIYAGTPAKMLKPRAKDLLGKEKEFLAAQKKG